MSAESRVGGRWLWWLLWLSTALVLLAVAAGGAVLWLLGTTAGAQWLIGRVPAVTAASGLRGTLLGTLGAERLTLAIGDRRIDINGLDIDWRPAALLDHRLEIVSLSASRIDVTSPRSDEPVTPPDGLALPLAVRIGRLRVEQLRLLEDQTLRFAATAITASGESDGGRHRLHELRATHEYGTLAGSGQIAVQPPFGLRAQALLRGRDERGGEPPVIRATALGNLDELIVSANGSGAGLSGTAQAELRPFDALPLAALRLALAEFDPQAFVPQLPHARLTAAADLKTRADGRLSGPVRVRNAAPAALDRDGLPVSDLAAFLTLGEAGQVTLAGLDIGLAGGGRIGGTAGWDRRQEVGTADLLVAGLDLAAIDTRLRKTHLMGHARLGGGLDAQQGHLALADGALRIDAALERAGDEITLNRLRLRLDRNRLDAHGRWGGRGNRLELVVDAPVLAAFGPGFGGSLAGKASLAGSLEQPQGRFTARGRDMVLFAHRLASLTASGEMRGEAVELALDAGGYARGEDAEALVEQLSVKLGGRRDRHDVRLAARFAEGRRVALRARGGLAGGRRQWREARWRGTVEELDAVLPPPLRLSSPVAVLLSRERIEVGAASFAAGGGRIAHAASRWTPQGWQSRGSFGGVGLRLAGGDAPPEGESLRLGGAWDLKAVGARLTGSFEVAREAGDWILAADPPLPLGISTLELAARASGDRIDLRLAAAGRRLGDWRGQANLSLPPQRAAGSIPPETTLNGSIAIESGDIAWIGAALGSDLGSSGRLSIKLDLGGSVGAPDFRGQAQGSELAVAVLDQGVRLERGELLASFDADRVRIERLRFAAPHVRPPPALGNLPFAAGGTLEGSGSLDLRARSGQLDFIASRMPITQRPDRWIVASGRGSAGFAEKRLTLTADARVDAGLIAEPPADRPRLAEDVVIAGRQPSRTGPRIDLTADIDLGERFRLRASGLDARLDGRLRLRGEPGQPLRASGSIAAVDGTFAAYGQRLTVERGIVNFQGAVDDPGLNMLALRKGLAVEAGVEVTGTVRRPSVRLVSTPAVPDPEKLSWIVLGHAPESAGTDSALLMAAAGALLGGQSGGPTAELAQALGVDELGLRSAPGAESLTGQIVTIGKRLSSRATLGYEQGLSAAAGVVKLTWQLSPRVSLVTRAGTDNAIDLYYTFSFD